jgi:Rha family phage regulatory protein
MNVAVNQSDFNGLVSEEMKTTSRIIAEKFGKSHNHVLRDIRKLTEANPEWGMTNFGQTPYVDAQNGQTYQMYEMTRDGYSMLVMGFTGRKAMEWKIKFLEAFNAMAQFLQSQSAPQLPNFADPAAAARAWADEVEKKKALALENHQQAEQIEQLTPKAEAYDQIDALEGALSIRPASKILSIPEHKLKTWLQVNKWAFRQNGKGPLQAYSDKRNVGYLDHKLGSYENSKGEKVSTITLMITPKGLKRLASVFAKEGGAA